MILVAAFNPTSATSGQFIASTLQTGSKMVVNNKSYVDITFTFSNGDVKLILANDRRAFEFEDSSVVANPVVNWTQKNIDYPQTAQQLENICYVEIYQSTEVLTEQYPVIIQRQPVPNLLPYSIGAGCVNMGIRNGAITPAQRAYAIWPSSYIGVKSAPNSTYCAGDAYDHFWTLGNIIGTVGQDVPGLYVGTGKTGNNLSLIDPAHVATAMYGPLSPPGLPIVNSAIRLGTQLHWNAGFAIPFSTVWAAGNGYIIDFWINLSSFATKNYILSDGTPLTTNTGINIYTDTSGILTIEQGFSGGATVVKSPTAIPLNTWTMVSYYNTGTAGSPNLLFINGVQVGSVTTSGTAATSVTNMMFGENPLTPVNLFSGGIALMGIRYNAQLITGGGLIRTPMYWYEWATVLLNTDIQNAWITAFDLSVANDAVTSWYEYYFANIFNPSGLLYKNTPFIKGEQNLELYVSQPLNQTLQYNTQSINAQGENTYQKTFPSPLTQYNEISFITFNDWQNTGPHYKLNVYGYNLLGIA